MLDYRKIKIPNLEYRGGNTFRFRTRARDIFGKSVTVSETIKVPDDITNLKDAKKYLENEKDALKVKNKRVYKHSERTFSDIIDEYVEFKSRAVKNAVDTSNEASVGKRSLSIRTLDSYIDMIPRIKAGLGHLKLKDITAIHIEKLMLQMNEPGARFDVKYKAKGKLVELLKTSEVPNYKLAANMKIGYQTLLSLLKQYNVDIKTASKVSEFFELAVPLLFDEVSSNRPLKSKTINNYVRFISSVFNYAVKAKYIDSNPCSAVDKYIVVPTKKEPVDKNDLSALMNKLWETDNYNLYAQISILALTGCRRGEMLGLRYNDINFEKSTIRFDEAVLYTANSGVYLSSTKSSQVRTIKASSTLLEIILNLKNRKLKQCESLGIPFQENFFLFENKHGGYINPTSYGTALRRFKNKYHFENTNICALSLRHFFATTLIENNKEINSISRTMGHANIATTERYYKDIIDAHNLENLSQDIEDIIKMENK